MATLEFSVPYNGDPKLLPELFRLKTLGSNRIKEIYLSGPWAVLPCKNVNNFSYVRKYDGFI
jgi:hypothetical protein